MLLKRPLRPLAGLVAIALVTAAGSSVASAAAPRSSAATAPSVSSLVPPTGALFGAVVPSTAKQSATAAFTSLEAQLGRKLDMQRVYQSWDDAEPSPTVRWDVANGHVPMISIKTTTHGGTIVPWASIAAGKDDAAIVAQADGLKSLGVPVLLAFNHEPELATADGTAADYVAAYQHYVDVFRAQGAANVAFAFISGTAGYASGLAASYYPGDSYIDWIGVDAYNGDGCTTGHGVWSSFSSVVAPFYSFGTAHDKPLIVAEWGSVEDPAQAGLKGQWITDAASAIAAWPAIKAVEYFDSAGANPSCGWPLSTSASAQSAITQMGTQASFNVKPQAALTVAPASGAAPLSVSLNGSATISGSSGAASWSLNYGDGSPVLSGTGSPPSGSNHAYAAGSFTAQLTVTDTNGQTDVSPVVITSDPPPIAVTQGASNRTANGATYAGMVKPLGLDTMTSFRWGTTTAYGSSSPPSDAGNGSTAVNVAVAITGLLAATTYHYQFVAVNAAGTTYGADATFRTSAS